MIIGFIPCGDTAPSTGPQSTLTPHSLPTPVAAPQAPSSLLKPSFAATSVVASKEGVWPDGLLNFELKRQKPRLTATSVLLASRIVHTTGSGAAAAALNRSLSDFGPATKDHKISNCSVSLSYSRCRKPRCTESRLNVLRNPEAVPKPVLSCALRSEGSYPGGAEAR